MEHLETGRKQVWREARERVVRKIRSPGGIGVPQKWLRELGFICSILQAHRKLLRARKMLTF